MRRTSGLSLLILIFVSLCLILFPCFRSRNPGQTRHSAKKWQHGQPPTTRQTQKPISCHSKIDAQLANYYKLFSSDASSTPESSYYDSCRQIADVIPEVCWDTDTHTVSFAIAITESQQLAVVLAVDFPKKDTDTLYHITTWEIVNTQDWAVDTSMKLLRTDMPESET